MSLVLFQRNARRSFFKAHSLYVQQYASPPTASDVELVEQQLQAGVRAFGRVSLLSISTWDSGQASAEAREQAARLLDRHEAAVLGVASVVLGRGQVRALFSGLEALRTTRAPVKLFTAVPEALSWLEGLPGQHPDTVKALSELEWHLVRPVSRAA